MRRGQAVRRGRAGGRVPGPRVGRKARLGLGAALAIVLAAVFVGVCLRLSPAAAAEGSAGEVTRVLGSAAAPAGEARAVLATLVGRRAQALTARDLRALAAADGQGSTLLAADEAIIAELVQAEQRYVGLTFTVTVAEWVSVDAGSARIRAVVERSGYRVQGPGDHEQSIGADSGRSLLYSLVRVGEEWRISTVTG